MGEQGDNPNRLSESFQSLPPTKRLNSLSTLELTADLFSLCPEWLQQEERDRDIDTLATFCLKHL